jgi:hypothetical protein
MTTEQLQIDFKIGEALRDAGMQSAVDHADKVVENWSEIAYNFLTTYVLNHHQFLTEDVRAASASSVPLPPHARAWGGVMVRAAKAGIIQKAGYARVKNPLAHCTPATLWQSNRI